jgi:hypothetical protein
MRNSQLIDNVAGRCLPTYRGAPPSTVGAFPTCRGGAPSTGRGCAIYRQGATNTGRGCAICRQGATNTGRGCAIYRQGATNTGRGCAICRQGAPNTGRGCAECRGGADSSVFCCTGRQKSGMRAGAAKLTLGGVGIAIAHGQIHQPQHGGHCNGALEHKEHEAVGGVGGVHFWRRYLLRSYR